MTPSTLLTAAGLKEFSRNSGIHAIGWFAASDFGQYLETIREREEYHHIAYRSEDAFTRAGRIPEGIRTVLVLVMDYFVETCTRREGLRLSNYARACWPTVNPRTKALSEFLRAKGCRVQTLDLPQRAAACRAGLGFIGRNAMFYAGELGSYVGIASLGIDVMLETENPPSTPERVTHPACETCGLCITACPVAAIPAEGYRISPLRCLSMVSRHPDEPGRVMPARAAQLEDWLYGCEACQDVCPLNAAARHRQEAVLKAEITIEGLPLPNTAVVSRELVVTRQESITSPGFREYVQTLIHQRDNQSCTT